MATFDPAGQPSIASKIDTSWAEALAPVKHHLAAMDEFLCSELLAGRRFIPARENVMRAFTQPFHQVRVLIVGQDPYPTPGHPIGLAFAVERHVRPLPPSLRNIYRELCDDLQCTPPMHGDLTTWENRGVLLLNRLLTLEPGKPGSHRGKGWEEVTDQVARALAARGTPLVAILWGADAHAVQPLLKGIPVIKSAHPSLMTASLGFFGSRPFSRANALLAEQGVAQIDWLPG